MQSPHVIREARLRAGITQAELAHRVGTTQSAIARWESGRVRPSLESVTAVVRACGLDLRFRLVRDDDHDWGLVLANLRLTPEERLQQLVAMVSFIERGRAARRQMRG